MMGALIGSGPGVTQLGEYGGFYLAYEIAREELGRMPNPFLAQYFRSLRDHAISFATSIASEENSAFFIDSTPWNLLIADELAHDLTGAIFILMLRHYSGVVQSLSRSDPSTYPWVGTTWKERAKVWSRFYGHAGELPFDRTVVVSYDKLCSSPGSALEELSLRLAAFQVDVESFDLSALATSHATNPCDQRPVLAHEREGGYVTRPIASWDPQSWPTWMNKAIEPIVAGTDALLRQLFPVDYISPAHWVTPSGDRDPGRGFHH